MTSDGASPAQGTELVVLSLPVNAAAVPPVASSPGSISAVGPITDAETAGTSRSAFTSWIGTMLQSSALTTIELVALSAFSHPFADILADPLLRVTTRSPSNKKSPVTSE
jgi:hypothetical protein